MICKSAPWFWCCVICSWFWRLFARFYQVSFVRAIDMLKKSAQQKLGKFPPNKLQVFVSSAAIDKQNPPKKSCQWWTWHGATPWLGPAIRHCRRWIYHWSTHGPPERLDSNRWSQRYQWDELPWFQGYPMVSLLMANNPTISVIHVIFTPDRW